MLSSNAVLFAAEFKFDSPENILENTRRISEAIDSGIAVLWDFLTSELFLKISEVGAIIAGLGIGFYTVKWVKEVAKSEEFFLPDKMPQIAFGLLLVILLGTPTERGKLLADLLVGYDALSTSLTNTVLVAARPDPTKDPIASVQTRQAIVDRATQDAAKCRKLPQDSQEIEDCVREGIERVKASIAPLKQNGAKWASRTEDELIYKFWEGTGVRGATAVGQAIDEKDFIAVRGFFEDGLNRALIGFTFALTVVWLLFLRIAKPLISIVFPLYIGLSYIPSSKPPVVWAVGILIDLVLVEIIFKIFLSMIAQLALTLPLQVDTLILGLLLVFCGIPASWILGRRLSDGLTGVGLAAFPFLSRRFR
ncbi:MAG: hypothetical protein HC851_18645 [Acaryochloris sp. RU_4_1]|nr:hypothetical protein [Acaryochloris sp. RU_4_1]NJR56604.1 hypothetical protein [Acaryochloris sp. CRU_2_0]